MYKVLITTWAVDLGSPNGKAASVHTIVVEFDTPSMAIEANNIINLERSRHGITQTALLLFKP